MLRDIIAVVITSHKCISELESELFVDSKTAHPALEAPLKLHGLNLFTAPEAPVNLQVTERNAHTIELMWQHPSITNGKVRQFYIQVNLISSHLRRPEQEVNIPGRLLEVLQPSQNYSYVVS
jgi:hypothetical protein